MRAHRRAQQARRKVEARKAAQEAERKEKWKQEEQRKLAEKKEKVQRMKKKRHRRQLSDKHLKINIRKQTSGTLGEKQQTPLVHMQQEQGKGGACQPHATTNP